jgi:hypothetical protein
MATRILVAGLVVAVALRMASFGRPEEWIAIALLWACGLPLLAIRYLHAKEQDRRDAGLTSSRVRYGVLLVAIVALGSGKLTDGPTAAAGIVFTLTVVGFGVLTAAAAVNRRRRERAPAS